MFVLLVCLYWKSSTLNSFHNVFFSFFCCSFISYNSNFLKLIEVNLASMVDTLKLFIEGSTLGEFHTRLQMLLEFHCHTLLMTQKEKNSKCCFLFPRSGFICLLTNWQILVAVLPEGYNKIIHCISFLFAYSTFYSMLIIFYMPRVNIIKISCCSARWLFIGNF